MVELVEVAVATELKAVMNVESEVAGGGANGKQKAFFLLSGVNSRLLPI